MRVSQLIGLIAMQCLLSGCISLGSAPAGKTTVVVPPGSTATVVCQAPPCN